MKSLHELTFSGNRQVTGDFAEPGEKQTLLELSWYECVPAGEDDLKTQVSKS